MARFYSFSTSKNGRFYIHVKDMDNLWGSLIDLTREFKQITTAGTDTAAGSKKIIMNYNVYFLYCAV